MIPKVEALKCIMGNDHGEGCVTGSCLYVLIEEKLWRLEHIQTKQDQSQAGDRSLGLVSGWCGGKLGQAAAVRHTEGRGGVGMH